MSSTVTLGESSCSYNTISSSSCSKPYSEYKVTSNIDPCDAIPVQQSSCSSKSYSCESSRYPYERSSYSRHRSERCRRKKSQERAGHIKLQIPVGAGYLKNVVSDSGTDGVIWIEMRRINKTVTLQWEGFKGAMNVDSVSYITLNAVVLNLPTDKKQFPIRIVYNGKGIISFFEIDPADKSGIFKIYLNIEANSSSVKSGNSIEVPGTAISWITEC